MKPTESLGHTFFDQARFLILPTREEIESEILVPGHRFLPFYDFTLKPSEIRIFMKKREIKRTYLSAGIGSLSVYFSLFGAHRLAELLLEEDEKNSSVLTQETSEATVSVFDMSRTYRMLSVRPGDGFIATVLDWSKGLFEISFSPVRARAAKQDEITEWGERLETSFLRVIDLGRPETDMESQLAEAFIGAGSWPIEHPFVSLAQFINRSAHIGIAKVGEREIFVRKSAASDDDSVIGESRTNSEDEFDELTRLFMRHELILTTALYEGYARDARFRGIADKAILDESVFGAAWLDGLRGTEDGRIFTDQTERVWNYVGKDCDREDDRLAGPLRSYCLTLFEKVTEALSFIPDEESSSIGREETDPDDPFSLMNLLVVQLHSIVSLLNAPAEIKKTDADEFREALEQVESGLSSSVGTAGSDVILPTASAKKVPDDACYVMTLTLDGSDPVIRRRLRIPSRVTLRDLHDAIQAVMDWKDFRAHEFVIDGKRFGLPGDTGNREVTYDAEHTVGQTLGLDTTSLAYRYRYGGGWNFTITVDAIELRRETDGKNAAIELLDGAEASPPEDIGGIGGYRELLDVLARKNAPDRRLAKEMLGKKFDPRRFDLEAARERINPVVPEGRIDGRRKNRS